MFLCLLALSAPAWGGVNEDWRRIVDLDAGPQLKFGNREEARLLAIGQLDRQEPALRAFIAAHPEDPRAADAGLRLAHLLAVRSDLQSRPAAYAEAMRVLDGLEKSAPPARLADIAFARISLHMRRLQEPEPTERQRDDLLAQARVFESRFAGDRRIAPLLTEIATLYDREPDEKRNLLNEALGKAPGEALVKRINDDLKRIAMLGRPITLAFTSVQGGQVDVRQFRGSVTLVYFFASWSSPSVAGLGVVKGVLSQFGRDEVKPVGVSLDTDKNALDAELKTYGVNWPVYFDGKGWDSPLVRSFGINAIPTVWILDRAGNLRTLSGRDDTEGIIRGLLRER